MTVKQKESFTGVLFASPFLIGFIFFFIAPFFISVFYTFTFGASGGDFVGLKNYIDVLESAAFKLTAWNTLCFILIGVSLIMLFALIFSFLIHKKFGGSSFFRLSSCFQ